MITFAAEMLSKGNIEELSIAFLREGVDYDVVGDYFAHDEFGIIMDYRWAKGALLETDRPADFRRAGIPQCSFLLPLFQT